MGNVTGVTDPDGNVTSYSYDRLNRQVQTTDPLWNVSTTKYDADGNVVQTTDADGHVIQYVYDAVGHHVQENWLDASGSVIQSTVTSYDAAGQVVGVIDPSTRYEYTYDQDGRVLSASMAPGDMPQTYLWGGSDTETLPANTRFYYTISASAGTVLTISLASSQFDAYLILQSPTGTNTVVVDDDGGGGTNAFLEVPLEETGNWTVWVTGSPKAARCPAAPTRSP